MNLTVVITRRTPARVNGWLASHLHPVGPGIYTARLTTKEHNRTEQYLGRNTHPPASVTMITENRSAITGYTITEYGRQHIRHLDGIPCHESSRK